jgi:hypothetical protein
VRSVTAYPDAYPDMPSVLVRRCSQISRIANSKNLVGRVSQGRDLPRLAGKECFMILANAVLPLPPGLLNVPTRLQWPLPLSRVGGASPAPSDFISGKRRRCLPPARSAAMLSERNNTCDQDVTVVIVSPRLVILCNDATSDTMLSQ